MRPQPGQAAEGIVARVRIGVTKDGIYRITPSDLSDAGIEVAEIDPGTFAMTSQGEDIAIRVVGEADGRFQGNDYIEFFGEKYRSNEQDEKYTDENVYWLDMGTEPGPRILDVDGAPQGNLTPPPDFAASVLAEESNWWYTQHTMFPPTKDTWFWDRLRPIGSGRGVTATLPYTIPYPAPGRPYTLTIDENARISDDHRTVVALNGAPLIDENWYGKTRHVFTTTVPADLVVHGLNPVSISAYNNAANSATRNDRPSLMTIDDWADGHGQASLAPAGAVYDDVYVNWWRLDYRRLFSAWQGQIDFRSEASATHEYLVDGWDSTAVEIWRMAFDSAMPSRLVGASSEHGEMGYALRFRSSDHGGTYYWIQAVSTIGKPANIRRYTDPNLLYPSRGADTVIVTSAALRPAAEQLASWHESQGRRALVADFLDITDAFNDGIYHPRAVTNMLNWAKDNWPGPPPHYLVLFGDGHWNFKGYNPSRYPNDPIHIPPYLAWVDPWQGEVPSANHYADLNDDRRPDLAVGEIPVNTLAEGYAVVGKIMAYDSEARSEPWQKRALFVADRNDPSAGDFPTLTEEIVTGHLPPDLQPIRVYLGVNVDDAATANAMIADTIDDGVWMVQYAGHGAPDGWSKEDMWTIDDVPALNNVDQPPVVMTFNCLDGYSAYPGKPSLAETMLRHNQGGSVAAISPSGLGLTADQHQFRTMIMDILFKEDVRTLGDALLLAKQRYYDDRGPHYLVDTLSLFGDPSLLLPHSEQHTQAYIPLFFHP
jgi:hypothetical protein